MTWFSLNSKRLTNEDHELVIESIQSNVKSLTPHLEWCKMKDEIIPKYLQVFETKQIAILDLKRNKITEIGAQVISDFLKTNKSVTSLLLDRNNLGQRGVLFLISTLEINGRLAVISLSEVKYN